MQQRRKQVSISGSGWSRGCDRDSTVARARQRRFRPGTWVADPSRKLTNGSFVTKAVKPHAGKRIHVVLDNLSTHDAPEVKAWLARNRNVTFHCTPVGSSWMNQIETWFGIITKQAIRRGTFTSVTALIRRIRDYIEHWNTDAQPFAWTATADEILAKVRWVETNVRQLVANNSK